MAEKEIEVFETTAGQVVDVLKRLRVPQERMVTVMIEPDDWLTKARQASRRLVIEAGLNDDDIDQLIKRAQEEVEPRAEWGWVVDTNVFVSAALKENSLPFHVVRWIDRHDGLLKSADTDQQLLDVLSRPYIARVTIPALCDGIVGMLALAEVVPIAERIAACRDPTDDKFLELAVNGRAELIISGDADLLVLHPFRAIPIVTPATFLRSLAL
jgi:uncharacterized protein